MLVGNRYLIDCVTRGENIELWGDPYAFKNILYIKDLCQMMYLVLFADIDGGTYNAGTGIKTTLLQQIEGIIDVFTPTDQRRKIVKEVASSTSFTGFVMDIDNARED